MKIPSDTPIAMGALTKEQLDVELAKGMADINAGKVYSADDVENEMRREFGI